MSSNPVSSSQRVLDNSQPSATRPIAVCSTIPSSDSSSVQTQAANRLPGVTPSQATLGATLAPDQSVVLAPVLKEQDHRAQPSSSPTIRKPDELVKQNIRGGREGVYDHRVIYERRPSPEAPAHNRSPSVDRHRPAHQDRSFRPRDDRVDLDERKRDPSHRSSSVRSDDRGSGRRSRSVTARETHLEVKLEPRRQPVLIADDRQLPQDRLFPPDDPRAPIDNSAKNKALPNPLAKASSTPNATPAPAVPEPVLQTVTTFANGSTTAHAGPAPSTPTLNVSSSSRTLDPRLAPNAAKVSFSSGPQPTPAASVAPSPSPAIATFAEGEERRRLLSEALPLSSRPSRRASGTTTVQSTPEGQKQGTSFMQRLTAPAATLMNGKDLKDRAIGMPLSVSSSLTLLERLSDAPSASVSRVPSQGGPGTPSAPRQQVLDNVVPKTEPMDDRGLLSISSSGSKPSIMQASMSLGDIRSQAHLPATQGDRDRQATMSGPPHDTRRSEVTGKASYEREPHVHEGVRRPSVDGRYRDRYGDRARYDERDRTHTDPWVRPPSETRPYPADGRYSPPPLNRAAWSEYDTYDRGRYGARGRSPERTRPHVALEARLTTPPLLGYAPERYAGEPNGRIRPRSPSPVGYDAPPYKRPRDDAYAGYYDPAPRREDDERERERLYYESQRLREAYPRDVGYPAGYDPRDPVRQAGYYDDRRY
jgi:hypothetical protein